MLGIGLFVGALVNWIVIGTCERQMIKAIEALIGWPGRGRGSGKNST